MPTTWTGKHARIACVIVITGAAAYAFWPALRSALYLDDFFLTAIARLVDNPAAPFFANHFPGGLFYRPLGITFWWLAVAVFGHAPKPQYAINLVLHLAICLSLWRLLLGWTQSRLAAFVTTLAYAVHPVTVGTALWLSDRFDLLAILFGVWALDAGRRYRDAGHLPACIATLACAACATLSKEIGLAVLAPLCVIWLWPAAPATAPAWRVRATATAALVGLGAVLFGLRAWILGGAIESHFADGLPVWRVIVDGVGHWAWNFVYFVGEIHRLHGAAAVFATLGIVGIVLLALVGAVRAAWRFRTDETDVPLALAGLALVAATAVLQAPTLRIMALVDTAPATALMATESRLFCYSLLGALVAACALVRIALRGISRQQVAGIATAVLIACGVLPWAADAHFLSRQYRRESYVHMRLLDAARDAVATLPAPSAGCMVFLLDPPAEQEFIFSMQVDAAMKALATDLRRVEGCRFTTLRTPWFYVMRRGTLDPASAAPMRPVILDAGQAPWPAYGGVELAYLNLYEDVDARALGGAQFLAWQGQRFDNVTADVLAGRRAVAFHCGRRPQQCALGRAP